MGNLYFHHCTPEVHYHYMESNTGSQFKDTAVVVIILIIYVTVTLLVSSSGEINQNIF